MAFPQIPRFVWVVLGIALVLIVLVLLKVQISIGPGGVSLSQGLVH